MNLDLSEKELKALEAALAEMAANMDDDGRDGLFDTTHLRPIYDKVRKLLNAANQLAHYRG
jgi:hypothetical protein